MYNTALRESTTDTLFWNTYVHVHVHIIIIHMYIVRTCMYSVCMYIKVSYVRTHIEHGYQICLIQCMYMYFASDPYLICTVHTCTYVSRCTYIYVYSIHTDMYMYIHWHVDTCTCTYIRTYMYLACWMGLSWEYLSVISIMVGLPADADLYLCLSLPLSLSLSLSLPGQPEWSGGRVVTWSISLDRTCSVAACREWLPIYLSFCLSLPPSLSTFYEHTNLNIQ